MFIKSTTLTNPNPPKSELRERKVRELKSQLIGQQLFFHTVEFTSTGRHRSIVASESL